MKGNYTETQTQGEIKNYKSDSMDNYGTQDKPCLIQDVGDTVTKLPNSSVLRFNYIEMQLFWCELDHFLFILLILITSYLSTVFTISPYHLPNLTPPSDPQAPYIVHELIFNYCLGLTTWG